MKRSDYFDSMTNNNFMPLITLPTRITSSSKTLIDNILYNQFSDDIISGNITVGISDHIPQFSIVPFTNQNHIPKNKNIYIRKLKNLDEEHFKSLLDTVDWSFTENTSESNVNEDAKKFISNIEDLLDKYAPLTKLNNKELKQKNKPWITKPILKLIKIRNRLYNKFIKEKDIDKKEQMHKEFKFLKNTITKEIRSKKKQFYQQYFLENSTNARKLWAGINEIINIKPSKNSVPNCIEEIVNKETNETKNITDPVKIADNFNNYFTSIADEILKDRKYAGNKHFSEYLKQPLINSFMIKPTDKTEIESLISKTDPTKKQGPIVYITKY